MEVAIDVSPLTKGNFLQHRVRGTGFYLENLKKSLLKYYPENSYIFFQRGEKLSNNVDLIHYPYFEPFFLTLPILQSKKRIVTVHDLIPLVFPKSFPPGIKGNIRWQLQKMALKKSECIITDSKASKQDIVKFTGIKEEKIKVVYLAAGENFRIIKKSKSAIKNLPAKFALYVGDATWNKNLVRLVEAINKLQIPLVMVGKVLIDVDYDKINPWNSDLAKVQNMISNNKNIISTGFVSEEDLISLYNMASVFVMPSIYEGFGLPILEAMACGCPVVTTKEGSISEIAGNAVLYVDAYDTNDIANGIRKVFFNDDLQNQLSEKGLEQAKKFSWEKTAKETLEVYKEAVS